MSGPLSVVLCPSERCEGRVDPFPAAGFHWGRGVLCGFRGVLGCCLFFLLGASGSSRCPHSANGRRLGLLPQCSRLRPVVQIAFCLPRCLELVVRGLVPLTGFRVMGPQRLDSGLVRPCFTWLVSPALFAPVVGSPVGFSAWIGPGHGIFAVLRRRCVPETVMRPWWRRGRGEVGVVGLAAGLVPMPFAGIFSDCAYECVWCFRSAFLVPVCRERVALWHGPRVTRACVFTALVGMEFLGLPGGRCSWPILCDWRGQGMRGSGCVLDTQFSRLVYVGGLCSWLVGPAGFSFADCCRSSGAISGGAFGCFWHYGIVPGHSRRSVLYYSSATCLVVLFGLVCAPRS